MAPNRNGWQKYQEYVLHELDDLKCTNKEFTRILEKHVTEQSAQFLEVQVALTGLKTKLTVWAAVLFGLATLLSPFLSEALQFLIKR